MERLVKFLGLIICSPVHAFPNSLVNTANRSSVIISSSCFSSLNSDSLAEWNVDDKSEGFATFWNPVEESSDLDLQGPLRVAATLSVAESLYKVALSNGKIVNIFGSSNIGYAFLTDLQEIFNFTTEIIESKGWITQGQNDTVTGAGYQVTSGQADISIDISKPVPYRALHLRFLHSIKQDRIAIMFRQPKVQMYRNILQGGMWKWIIASWAILFAISVLASWNGSFPPKIQDIPLAITATILARGIDLSSLFQGERTRSLRMVILVSSVFGFTMCSIYSAFIVSTLRRAEAPIKNFQQLVNYEYELLAQGSLPDFTNVYVYDRKIGNYYAETARRNFISIKDSLKRLFSNRHFDNSSRLESSSDQLGTDSESSPPVAWFALKSDFAYYALQNGYTSRQICEITQLDPTARAEHPRVLSMFVGKNNLKLKEQFNRRILDILARGIGQRHVQQFENEFQPKCGERRLRLSRIRFFDVYIAYMLLLAGALAAFCIWIFGEILLTYILHTKLNIFAPTKYQVQVLQVKQEINVRYERWSVPRVILNDNLELSDVSIQEFD